MDTYQADSLLEFRPAGPPHPFSLASLSLRLAQLRQRIERDYAIVVALDFVNRDAIDGLAPDLTERLHTLLEEAALNAAQHAHGAMVRVYLQVNGGTVLIGIEDDGKGFPFIGIYDLPMLTALDVGPRRLMEIVTRLGGTMMLISRVTGTRIDIALSRDASAEARHAPGFAAA